MPKFKLESFFSQFKLLSYKKNQLVLRAEDAPAGIYCIKKGYVRQYLLSKDGHELTTSIYKIHDIFPLNWAINNTVDRYYFETMTSAEIWRSPKDKFLELVTSQPQVFYMLVSRLINRLDVFSQRMEQLAFGHAKERVASALLLLAERFGKKKKGGICIQIPLTHKDIASLLGLTRETVSIKMKKLEKKGIFTDRRQMICINSIKKLQKQIS